MRIPRIVAGCISRVITGITTGAQRLGGGPAEARLARAPGQLGDGLAGRADHLEHTAWRVVGGIRGDLLKGVRYRSGGASTQSIVMRSKSGTIRVIDSYHRLEKLALYSAVDFDGHLPTVRE